MAQPRRRFYGSPAHLWGVIAVSALVGLGAFSVHGPAKIAPPGLDLPGRDLRLPGLDPAAIRADAAKIAPLHEAKSLPGPQDWLATHPEPGQTFDAYIRSNPNRLDDVHTTLYVQPLGVFTEAQTRLMDDTVDFLGRFYGVPVTKLPILSLDIIPASARRVHPTWKIQQILTTYILAEVLAPRRPADALAVIAFTTSDLWPGKGWNFVFGQASLSQRVGVWSLGRFGNLEENYTQALIRTLKTAVHETGHMLGMPHCAEYQCAMNGSNSLPEVDSVPLAFCPQCEAKVWWACRVDPVQRYASLADFARRHGLTDQAAFWTRSLGALQPK